LIQLSRALRAHAATGRPLLLGLDFDGTLAPTAAHPDLAALSTETADLLRRLSTRPPLKIAIVSGRGLADLRAKVALPSIFLAGSYGLELEGPGVAWVHPEAAPVPAVRALRGLAARFEGAWLEDKKWSACLHYRQAPARARRPLRDAAARLLRPFRRLIRARIGPHGAEIRPRLDWDKGSALIKLSRLIGGRPRLGLVGNDWADEEGFRRLGGGALTIRVGQPRRSFARYLLRGQRQVPGLLKEVAQAYRA
jgi:trehalose 6-phosphate phosphatase